jgi:hypothetical protein
VPPCRKGSLRTRYRPIFRSRSKLKKEKEESFKDLKNEKWLREFELEVTNTGDKPIYFLYIMLGTNVKDKEDGLELYVPADLWASRIG